MPAGHVPAAGDNAGSHPCSGSGPELRILEVRERALVVLVGVWAGRTAVGLAQRGMAGSPCFPSVPGASYMAGWGSGSPSP